TTVDLDSFVATVTQTRKIGRPPAPFTCDWDQARRSVEFLAGLRPNVIGCGHGTPMSGPAVAHELSTFAKNFPAPKHGRYAWQPAITDDSGIRYLPPPPPDPLPKIAAGIGIATVGTVLAYRQGKTQR
nr:MBL fold metallo-hydrolase [Acidobacteriota bacterium]